MDRDEAVSVWIGCVSMDMDKAVSVWIWIRLCQYG